MTPPAGRTRGASRRIAVEVDPLTGRRVLHGTTGGGTVVHVAPFPGFQRRYAVLTARYGSLDVRIPGGRSLPPGTAHFLEHKMFQKVSGDVFEVFDRRGAAANAFTTYASTSYLFSCTRHFEENLDTLLDTLGTLETDAAGVERERGIIGQEIAMYDDDPGWRASLALLGALYRRHPVRLDPAGTAASIRRIDRTLLAAVHQAFYRPSNLILVVAGDVDARDVLARAEARLPRSGPAGRHRRKATAEPAGVRRREVVEEMSVARPHVWLGLKDTPPGRGGRLLARQVLTGLVLDVLFGDGGSIQAPLYEEGVVDDTFQATYEAEADYAYAAISAEVEDVEPYRRVLGERLAVAAAAGIPTEAFERSRRRMIGRHVRLFNSPERAAHWLLGAALEDVSPTAVLGILDRATPRRAARRLRELLARPRAWALLEPRPATGRSQAAPRRARR